MPPLTGAWRVEIDWVANRIILDCSFYFAPLPFFAFYFRNSRFFIVFLSHDISRASHAGRHFFHFYILRELTGYSVP